MDATPPESPAPFPITPIPPELLAFARQTFNMEEYLEGVREIKETGGKTLDQFFAELEAAARGS